MNRKGIPQPVRADIVDSAGLRVGEFGQPCLLGAFFDNLPGPVAVNAEDEPLMAAFYGATTLDIFLQYGQCVAVDWECSLPAVLEIPCHCVADPSPAFGTEAVASSQTRSTIRTGKSDACLQVLDADNTSFKVDVFYSQAQGFTHPAAQAKEDTDKQTIP